jgi:hypothetical protein
VPSLNAQYIITNFNHGAARPWFDFWQGEEIFLFSTTFSPYLGPTQPIKWVPRSLFPGLKRRGSEADHSPPSSAEVKNGWALPALPICLHGMVRPSVRPSIHPSIHLSIYLSMALQPFVRPWPLFSLLIFYTVGLLGWGICQSQGRYLHRSTHRTNAHKHPCLKLDSNPRSQCLSGRTQFMP